MEQPLVYTPAELTTLLRLGRNTIYRLIRKNRIGSIRINRKVLIPREAVKDFLANRLPPQKLKTVTGEGNSQAGE